jgi:hypothetical protein
MPNVMMVQTRPYKNLGAVPDTIDLTGTLNKYYPTQTDYQFVGPTLSMIGMDAESYNAGASAGYDAGVLQSTSGTRNSGFSVLDYLKNNPVIAGLGVFSLLLLLSKRR